MANQILMCVFIISSFVTSTLQEISDNKVDSQEESPLASIASEILREKNLENIGGVVSSFIQSGGAKQIVDGVLKNLATNENSGQLLESLGNLFSGSEQDDPKKNTKPANKQSGGEINPMQVLSLLGSLQGAMQGGDGNQGRANPAALLQGLGTLLAGNGEGSQGGGNNAAALLQGLGTIISGMSQTGKEEESNPATNLLQSLSSVIGAAGGQNREDGLDMGALLQGVGSLLGGEQRTANPSSSSKSNSHESNKASKPKKTKTKKVLSDKSKSHEFQSGRKASQDDSFDLGSIVNVAGAFLSQMNGKSDGGGGGASFVDYLPMIMNTISAFTGPEAEKRALDHSDHSSIIPPIIEKIHVYFESFMNSDMGRQFLKYLEKQKSFKVFLDDDGKFDYEKFKELIENHSFRRHWIQQVAAKLVEYLQFLSDEKVQKQYVDMSFTFANSYLKNLGFPDHTLPNLKQPAKSITNFLNHAAKKYLDADIDSREYVEPVVIYLQDIAKLAKKSISSKELTDKLTDTINLEIIEPITRINRAYRFAQKTPKCDVYLFCVLNQESPPIDPGSLPALRKALYKGYSFIAAWFLQMNTGTSYWNFYDVITEKRDCRNFYNDACSGFYDEEVMVTTEYIHNEL